jgi:hypothetical protein
VRCISVVAAGLLAACSSVDLGPTRGPERGVERAVVAGTAPAPAITATATRPSGGPARNWDDYKVRVAQRVVSTSAGETFSGPLPDPLQSIPVLQVKLRRDGSIEDIIVLRVPRQSPQTVQMAIRAIRRAGPFEPVGHLPRPWQFSETFLYNEDLKFQLRTLVETPSP